MLEFDYSARLRELIQTTEWRIKIPQEWSDFFERKGAVTSGHDERRRHQRINVRTPGLLWFSKSLPAIPRGDEPIGIFTRDISRRGIGLVTPIELYPDEIVRAVLQTFWVQVRIASCRRVADSCYIAGTELVSQHPPGPEAFEAPTRAVAELAESSDPRTCR